jgi:hypothetical protein
VRTRKGRASFELVAGRAAGQALVEARLPDASAHASVQLLPGAPARLHLRAEAPSVRCNGRDSTPVHLRVLDAHGNPLDGTPPTLSAAGSQAEHGHFERVAALGGGEFVTRYHPPARCEGGEATLLAVAGEARGDARLTLTSRPPVGLSLRLGTLSNLGRLLQPEVEVEGDVQPYGLGGRLAASASLRVAWGKLRLHGQSSSEQPFEVSAHPLLATLSAGARWRLPFSPSLAAYAGAGLDAHLASISYRLSLEEGEQRQVSLTFGAHARLGLSLALGPGHILLQGRYGFARLPASAPFRGSIGGPAAALGYRFPL